MLNVEIHRDLTDFRPKVVGGLTARSLACTAAALATGVAAYGWLTWALGLPFEEVSILIYASTLPLWALGFLEPGGMRPERWLPLWLRQHSGAARITYDSAGRLRAALGTDDDTMGAVYETGRETGREYERFARRQRGIELWEPGGGPVGDRGR